MANRPSGKTVGKGGGRATPSIMMYADLLFLVWAWLFQWGSILKEVFLKILANAEGSAVATSSFEAWYVPVFVGLPSSSEFWYIVVFSGLLGILTTNVLGAMHFYRDGRYFLSALAACDLDMPYLVATQAREYARGGSPDLRGLRRRNALWRGLPCAAVSVFIAFRGVARTSLCQYATQVQMMVDPMMHASIEQSFGLEHEEVFPPLSHDKIKLAVLHEVNLRVAAMLQERFPEGACPAAQRKATPVNTYKEYVSTVGMAASTRAEVDQFTDLSAMQVGMREFWVEAFSQGVADSLPALGPFGLDPPKIDKAIIDGEKTGREREFRQRKRGRSFAVIYSNPHASLLLLQATLQLLIAARGLANHVRVQWRLTPVATAALYVHIFMDAVLATGCLVIIFNVLPVVKNLTSTRDTFLLEFHAISKPLMSHAVRIASLIYWGAEIGKSKELEYSIGEVIPVLEPGGFRIVAQLIDSMKGLCAPDLAGERLTLVSVMVVGGLLYSVLRAGLTKVGFHIFVTSPVVVLEEEETDPTSLAVQLGVKTAAVLSPYVLAGRAWIAYQYAVAQMLGLLVHSRVVYFAAVGICFAILGISGIVVIAHLSRPEDDDDYPDTEFLRHPPGQGCCVGVDRKRHKLAVDAVAARDAQMLAGEGWSLLGKSASTYGGCQP